MKKAPGDAGAFLYKPVNPCGSDFRESRKTSYSSFRRRPEPSGLANSYRDRKNQLYRENQKPMPLGPGLRRDDDRKI